MTDPDTIRALPLVGTYAAATLTPVILIGAGATYGGVWPWLALLYMTVVTFSLDTLITPADPPSGQDSAAARDLPEAASYDSPDTQVPLRPGSGPDYNPVVTLNGWSLPWRMNGNVKEFHLVAEPVERVMATGMIARLWGYNGQSTGPTIEAVEGERVRIYVTNRLPEHTSVHWHGLILPSGMEPDQVRHFHVPPACGRDGTNGHGHDGSLHRASARPGLHAGG